MQLPDAKHPSPGKTHSDLWRPGREPGDRRHQVRGRRHHRQLGHAVGGDPLAGGHRQPVLLLLGIKQSRKPAGREPPLRPRQGALLLEPDRRHRCSSASAAGCPSTRGSPTSCHPHPLEDPIWSYASSAAAFVFEGISWILAMRQLRPTIREKGLWKALRTSKDPSIVTVFFEDSAALVGLIVAFLGVFLGHLLAAARSPTASPRSSIGLLLAGVASSWSPQSRGLLLGESADPEVLDEHPRPRRTPIRRGRRSKDPLTMHLGPEEVLLNLEIDFRPGMPPGRSPSRSTAWSRRSGAGTPRSSGSSSRRERCSRGRRRRRWPSPPGREDQPLIHIFALLGVLTSESSPSVPLHSVEREGARSKLRVCRRVVFPLSTSWRGGQGVRTRRAGRTNQRGREWPENPGPGFG